MCVCFGISSHSHLFIFNSWLTNNSFIYPWVTMWFFLSLYMLKKDSSKLTYWSPHQLVIIFFLLQLNEDKVVIKMMYFLIFHEYWVYHISTNSFLFKYIPSASGYHTSPYTHIYIFINSASELMRSSACLFHIYYKVKKSFN